MLFWNQNVFLLNICNMLVLSGLLSPWGVLFGRGYQYPGWHYEWKCWIFSINFETHFLENENLFFKKIESSFTVESTTIESVTCPYKTALLEANVKASRMGSTKWNYHNERSFASIYFIFFEYFVSA